jgi:hypothetical protein
MRHVYLKCGRRCFVYEENGGKVSKKQVKKKLLPLATTMSPSFCIVVIRHTTIEIAKAIKARGKCCCCALWRLLMS